MTHVLEGDSVKGLGRASLVKGPNHLKKPFPNHGKPGVTRRLGPVGLRLCCLLHTSVLNWSKEQNMVWAIGGAAAPFTCSPSDRTEPKSFLAR